MLSFILGRSFGWGLSQVASTAMWCKDLDPWWAGMGRAISALWWWTGSSWSLSLEKSEAIETHFTTHLLKKLTTFYSFMTLNGERGHLPSQRMFLFQTWVLPSWKGLSSGANCCISTKAWHQLFLSLLHSHQPYFLRTEKIVVKRQKLKGKHPWKTPVAEVLARALSRSLNSSESSFPICIMGLSLQSQESLVKSQFLAAAVR